MSIDSSRRFLLQKFVCYECGSVLTISKKTERYIEDTFCTGEPTGADMVESVVMVRPCKKCLEPSRAVIAAINTILNIGKESK